MLKRFFVILVLSVSISACGFHLRGQLPIPDSIKVIAVQGKDKDLRLKLTEALSFNGATVVTSPSDALALLDLYKVNFERQVLTIDDRGKATGYTLRYRVSYRVTGAEGQSLRKGSITAQRDYNFDPDLVLQAEIEEESLREDMLTDITQRIMRQLSTIVSAAVPFASKVRA